METCLATEEFSINNDDIYEDAQLLHKCMTRKIKRDEDSDYSPTDDNHGEEAEIVPLPTTTTTGKYFQKPIYHCPECPRAYKSPVRLGNHVRDKHPYYDEQPASPPLAHRSKRARQMAQDCTKQRDQYSPDHTRSPPTPENNLQLTLYHNGYSSHKHSPKDRLELFTAKEHATQHNNDTRISELGSANVSPSGKATILNHNNTERKITVKGRMYECTGIRVSAVVDEIRFVESLENNKKRLQLANVALNQGLITPEEYATKQREFINAFNFF